MSEMDANCGPAEARALWYTSTRRSAINDERLGRLANGHLRVRAIISGISRGTEGLVFHGRVPQSEHRRMRAPFQAGTFPFPVKYGYACVGEVIAGPPEWRGAIVFALHPHQTLFDIPVDMARRVPACVPPERAVLAANLETAITALWDGGPALGDHIAVVGGGVVGALTAWLCAQLPATKVELVDTNPQRARLAADLGLSFALAENARKNNDLVIHASASQTGLATAIGLAGDEATIVEMSWYGDTPVTVPLGGAFHSRRLRLVATQVGHIPPAKAPRWDHARRMKVVTALLADATLDALLEPAIAFEDLPERLPDILKAGGDTLCQVVRYGDE